MLGVLAFFNETVTLSESITKSINCSCSTLMVQEEVVDILHRLGQRNSTLDLVQELEVYLHKNGDRCIEDYDNTCKEQRFSSGKYEKEIFSYLAAICKKQNGNGNAADASRVMILLGYESYRTKPKRFRQKIENMKKKDRNNTKKRSGRSTRHSDSDYPSDSEVTSSDGANEVVVKSISEINKRLPIDRDEEDTVSPIPLAPLEVGSIPVVSRADIPISTPLSISPSEGYNRVHAALPTSVSFTDSVSLLGFTAPDPDTFMTEYIQQCEFISQHKGSFITMDSYEVSEDDLFEGYIQQFDNVDVVFTDTNSEEPFDPMYPN